jgi:hypothetical protein
MYGVDRYADATPQEIIRRIRDAARTLQADERLQVTPEVIQRVGGLSTLSAIAVQAGFIVHSDTDGIIWLIKRSSSEPPSRPRAFTVAWLTTLAIALTAAPAWAQTHDAVTLAPTLGWLVALGAAMAGWFYIGKALAHRSWRRFGLFSRFSPAERNGFTVISREIVGTVLPALPKEQRHRIADRIRLRSLNPYQNYWLIFSGLHVPSDLLVTLYLTLMLAPALLSSVSGEVVPSTLRHFANAAMLVGMFLLMFRLVSAARLGRSAIGTLNPLTMTVLIKRRTTAHNVTRFLYVATHEIAHILHFKHWIARDVASFADQLVLITLTKARTPQIRAAAVRNGYAPVSDLDFPWHKQGRRLADIQDAAWREAALREFASKEGERLDEQDRQRRGVVILEKAEPSETYTYGIVLGGVVDELVSRLKRQGYPYAERFADLYLYLRAHLADPRAIEAVSYDVAKLPEITEAAVRDVIKKYAFSDEIEQGIVTVVDIAYPA